MRREYTGWSSPSCGTGPGPACPSPAAGHLLDAALPADPQTNVIGWPMWREFLPHVDAYTALAGRNGDPATATRAGRLLNQAGVFRLTQAEYAGRGTTP